MSEQPGSEPRTPETLPPEELGFNGCVAEIDAIIQGLESDRIDVDDLSRSVSRATELIEWCQNRLTGARTEVEEILERLTSPQESAEPDDEGEAQDPSGD